MKIDEVMMGDLVSVSGRPIHVTLAVLNTWSDSVKPIPITPEILEKNANRHYNEHIYDIYCFFNEKNNFNELVEITLINGFFRWSINGYEYSITEIKYVHELQHVLKLCRIYKEIKL